MARQIPVVHNATLVLHNGCDENPIDVGTPEWYTWLGSAKAFSFVGPSGSFSARRDRVQRGGWYWKAYHTREGKVRRTYLGKAEDLTLDRLEEAARKLILQDSTEHNQNASLIENAWYDSLLLAKLSVPPLRSNIVARPQLFGRLATGMQFKLILVSAPAGFGKTTLVAQWSLQATCRVAWLTLDRSDNDPARFWSYFVAAVQTVYPQVGRSFMSLLQSSRLFFTKPALLLLAKELAAIPEDLIIVLDDYHLVESQTVHNELAFLIDHLLQKVHIVIATRVDPPLPLLPLRAKAQMIELRAPDLALTLTEAETFLNGVMGAGLTVEQVTSLTGRTEGWVAALQLAALSLRRSDDLQRVIDAFSGSDRYIMDYFMDEVVSGQPEDIQRFLLHTCLLDRLNGPLCDAITGYVDCQAMLEKLDRSNLFTVSLDNQRDWYRYHTLFKDFLRSSLRRSEPSLVEELHRRASKWFIDNGLPREAMSHLIAVGDFEQVAMIIEQLAPQMLMRHEISMLLGFLKALPDEVVSARPWLCLHRAKAMIFTAQLGTAQFWLENAERALVVSNVKASAGLSGAANADEDLCCEIARLRLAIGAGRGDWTLTLALSNCVLESLQEDAWTPQDSILWSLDQVPQLDDGVMPGGGLGMISLVSQSTRSVPDAILALSLSGGIYHRMGHLHQAFGCYRRALKLAIDSGLDQTPIGGDPYIGLAALYYERNDLSSAEDYVLRGIELGNQAGFMVNVLQGHQILAMIRMAQGKKEESFQVLHRAEQLARDNGLADGIFSIKTIRARFLLNQGNIDEATECVEANDWVIDKGFNTDRWLHCDCLSMVRAARGEYDRAKELLEKNLLLTEKAGWTGLTIHSLATFAMVARAAGDNEQAFSKLARAISLAEPNEYIRSFVDRGSPMASLLAECLRTRSLRLFEVLRGVPFDYVNRLLANFDCQDGIRSPRLRQQQPVSTGVVDTGEVPVEALTGREIEIQRSILSGASNRQIAAEMFIAEGTVKKHINNLYHKLGVHNRAQLHYKTRSWLV